MAFGLLLVKDRLVLHEVVQRHVQIGVELRAASLVLLVEELRVGAAHADEPCGQIEPTTLAGGLIQASQGQFDFRMSVGAMHLAFTVTEVAVDAVRDALGDVQGTLGAGDLVVGDGRFDEMTHCVEFVAPTQSLEPLFGRKIQLELGVEVAVLVLGAFEQIDGLVHMGFEFVDIDALVPAAQRVAGGLKPLRHVGVLERLSGELAFLATCGDAQIAQRVAELAAVLAPGGAFRHVHGDLVVQCTPLVGQRVGYGHIEISCPETRRNSHVRILGLISHFNSFVLYWKPMRLGRKISPSYRWS